jgi:hypothetical protein
MICLQCGKDAKHTEDYDGVAIGTCEDGHRTGLAPRGKYNESRIEPVIEWDEIKKAS